MSHYLDELYVDEIGVDKIIESQAGGFRHRREGLAYRLYIKDAQGLFRPKKRVEASASLSEKRKGIYEKRELIRELSFEAYDKAMKVNSFDVLKEIMKEPLEDYQRLYSVGLGGKMIIFLKQIGKALLPESVIRFIKKGRKGDF